MELIGTWRVSGGVEGTVIYEMSLDGFVAGPNDNPENPMGDGGMRLFQWYNFNGITVATPPFRCRAQTWCSRSHVCHQWR